MQRNLTCIVCPRGCNLCVQLQEKTVLSVSGNACPRGQQYAQTECTHPLRTVTSTVRCADGSLLSVKTAAPIPKEKMMECMSLINHATATLPISIGDIVIADVFGTNIVATQNK